MAFTLFRKLQMVRKGIVNSGAIYRRVYKGYFHERLKLSLVGISAINGGGKGTMEIVGGVEIRRDPNCQLQSGEPVGRS